jgi:YD repeat-containing protein
VLDAMGNRTSEETYDPQSQLVRKHGRVVDALNRVFQEVGGTNPATQVSQYGFDADKNVTSIVDPLGRTTTHLYDVQSRVIETRDPLNGAASPTRYQYDGRDQLTRVTDPKGLSTAYTMNGYGEMLAQSSPDTGSTSFTYDAASNLKTKLDARGIQASYSYDELNRVTSIVYPDETVTYAYDTCANGLGRLCLITDRTGSTRYAYDSWGRVTSKTQVVGALTQVIAYEYNTAGQLVRVTLPSGRKIVYTYQNNRPVSVTVDGRKVLDGVFYEPFGPNGGWRWGNSTTTAINTHTRVFDLDFRATRITSDLPATGAQPAFDLRVSWDAQNRVTALTDLANRQPAASYGYDALDRLTSAIQGPSSLGFSYDPIGNRLTSTTNGAASTYSYVAGTHRLQSVTGAAPRAFAFDAAGNTVSDGATTWTYGGNNRPTQAGAVSFAINALGQRVKKSAGSSVTRFVYDEAGRLWGEYDDSGGLIAETIWLDDIPVAVLK